MKEFDFKRHVLNGINYDDFIEYFCKEFTTQYKRKAIDKILASMEIEAQ